MEKNQSEQYLQNNLSQQSNPSKLQEARFRKAMSTRVQNLNLSNIIGLTSSNKHNMQYNHVTGDLYYVAGSTIVVYNIESNSQKKYYSSPNKRNIVSICLSRDGRYLAAGEGTCKAPEIIIWDLLINFPPNEPEKPIKQLKGHKMGLKILLFSPNLKYLVSIGDEHDKGLFVWDWIVEERITLNKMSKVLYSACFSDDSTKLVTCGDKHIKLWQFQPNGDIIKTPVKEKENAFILEGKSIDIGNKFQDKIFTDCEYDKQSRCLYVSNSTGQLCIIDENRILHKWMDLKVQRIFNISLNMDQIICSCSDGYIRILKTMTLDHIVTFPRIPPLLHYNIEKGVTKIKPPAGKVEYADVTGLVYDEARGKVSAIYSDKSLFIWDITQLDKISMKRSFLNHSGGINDLQILNNPSSSEVTFFMTTSTDKTARIWHEISEENGKQIDNQNLGLRRNIYSKNLSRIIYLNQDTDQFKFQGIFKQNIEKQQIIHFFQLEQFLNASEEQNINQEIPQKEYPTCIKSTLDGSQIILANNSGLLTFMNVSSFEIEHQIQAHDKEITCIDIIETAQHRLLVTGGRDRQIKIFDLNNNYKYILNLDDHSSSIIGLKFALSQDQQTIYLVSAANDRQIIFREFKNLSFHTIYIQVDKNYKINSLDLSNDHQTIFVGFDKKINSYSISTGKLIKTTETKEEDKGTRMQIDNLSILTDVSSSYIASFNQDKVIRIRDCPTMQVVSKAHCGDTITGMGLTMNNSHLITSSSEGIIYIWKISTDLKNNIEKKRQSLGIIAKKLQDLFNKDGQNFINTKDWNLGSFWIEEEMRQHLMQQQKLNQNVPLQKNDYTDPMLANLKPVDLMKNANLPHWAITKPTQIHEQNFINQLDKNKKLDEEDDNLLKDFQDRIIAEKKPPTKPYDNRQNIQKTNNFVSDSEIIGDSINGRQYSYFQGSSIAKAVASKIQKQHQFGLDSLNERDDEGIFSNSKQASSIIGYNQQKTLGVVKNGTSNRLQQNDYEHHMYIDDNKVIGLKQQEEEQESDDDQINSDQISQFLSKQDMTLPVGRTQAQIYSKLQITNNKQSTNINKQSEQNYQQEKLIDIEFEEINNQENRKSLENRQNKENRQSYSNVNSNQSNKSEKNIDIKFKKDNGMVSLFSIDQIQGQLQKVEHNLKQAENNFKFKDEQLNIFQSSNQTISSLKQQIPKFSQNNIMNSMNNQDVKIQDTKQEQKQEDQLILLEDEDDENYETKVKLLQKINTLTHKQDTPSLNNKGDTYLIKETVQVNIPSKKDIESGSGIIEVTNQRKSLLEHQSTLKSGAIQQETIINKYDSTKLSSLNKKAIDQLKKDSPPNMMNKLQQFEENTQKDISNNQSANSEELNQAQHQKKTNSLGIAENKKSKEQEKTFIQSKIQSTIGIQNQYKEKNNMQPLEETNEEFDESYVVSHTKDYKQYQNEIDNSFRIILEQLSKIEDLVENKLDCEPVSVRRKVYEKISLKSNKVKASLQNINCKQQQQNQSNITTQFNLSYLDNDQINKDLLENYSKLLLEAVLKRK